MLYSDSEGVRGSSGWRWWTRNDTSGGLRRSSAGRKVSVSLQLSLSGMERCDSSERGRCCTCAPPIRIRATVTNALHYRLQSRVAESIGSGLGRKLHWVDF